MREIKITTARGVMRLNADRYFPTTQSDMRKLIRTIYENPVIRDADEKKEEVIEYLKTRIEELKKKEEHYEYIHNQACKPETDDFYDLMYLKKHADITIYVMNQIHSGIDKLRKNLELLEK